MTQYSCKFCNRRFDSIDKVKNHYLLRHNNEKKTNNNNINKTANNSTKNQITDKFKNQSTAAPVESSASDVNDHSSMAKKGKTGPTNVKTRGRTNWKIEIVGDIDEEDLLPRQKKRGRKPTGIKRKYPCDWPACTYVARHSVHLKDHKRTHTGEKPYRFGQQLILI